jgi:hypothetical protein
VLLFKRSCEAKKSFSLRAPAAVITSRLFRWVCASGRTSLWEMPFKGQHSQQWTASGRRQQRIQFDSRVYSYRPAETDAGLPWTWPMEQCRVTAARDRIGCCAPVPVGWAYGWSCHVTVTHRRPVHRVLTSCSPVRVAKKEAAAVRCASQVLHPSTNNTILFFMAWRNYIKTWYTVRIKT